MRQLFLFLTLRRPHGAISQAEIDEDAAAQSERLATAQRQKLSLLQHDLTACLLQLEAIEEFVQEVISSTEQSASPHQLLLRQPELLSRGHRLAGKPVPAIEHVSSDDLPRETAEREMRLRRAQDLEALLRVKDSLLWSSIEEGLARQKRRGEEEAAAAQAREWAESVQATSQEELRRWSELADSYYQRMQAMQAELEASQQEAAALKAHNERMSAYCQQMQRTQEQLRAARADAAAARAEAAQTAAHNAALQQHAVQLREDIKSYISASQQDPASI